MTSTLEESILYLLDSDWLQVPNMCINYKEEFFLSLYLNSTILGGSVKVVFKIFQKYSLRFNNMPTACNQPSQDINFVSKQRTITQI